ncbi:MAG: copper transporter [Methylocystaceae bacterium]
MIDIRYHIATLVAVFLALGLGILIGSGLVNSNVISDQQAKIIDQLKVEFEDLRGQKVELTAQNDYLSRMIKYHDEFNREMMPALIKNRLAGEQVAVVLTGGEQIPPGLFNTLSLAGVKVASTSIFLPNASMEDPGVRTKLSQYYNLPDTSSPEEMQSLVAKTVARIVSADGADKEIALLKQLNLVKMNGQFGVPVKAVIVVGGANDLQYYFPETIDQPLIEYFNEVKKTVYGVENAQVTKSYMDLYQKLHINTIDDIDLMVGQLALILSMDGEPGNFGVKSTAQKFMPALPVEYLGGTTP